MKEFDRELDPQTQALYRKILENGGFIPITSLPPWGKEIDGHFTTPEDLVAYLEENGVDADITAAFDVNGNVRHDLVTIFIDPGKPTN